MFGRRPDGRRVNDIDPVVKITPYVMPQRCDAQIFLKHRTDMELLASYIHKQADKGEKLGYMTILIAAYVRALSQNPCVNRFVMNKQLFARNNCSVSFNVLKDPYHIDKGELVCKTRFDLTDTIYDVRDRIEANIDALRGANAEEGFLEKLLNFGFADPPARPLRPLPRRPAERTSLPREHVRDQRRVHPSARGESPHLQFRQYRPLLQPRYRGKDRR